MTKTCRAWICPCCKSMLAAHCAGKYFQVREGMIMIHRVYVCCLKGK